MGEIVINSQDHKLYIIEEVEHGEATVRELTEEDIAKLPEAQQHVIRSLQLQAKALQELAIISSQAAQEMEKLQCLCDAEREWRHEIKQWVMQGWGYKPKLNPAARKPHRVKTYWHRTRSFCVRRKCY